MTLIILNPEIDKSTVFAENFFLDKEVTALKFQQFFFCHKLTFIFARIYNFVEKYKMWTLSSKQIKAKYLVQSSQ